MKSIEEEVYPLTIISDRYMGTYSGGKFTAWNVKAEEVPTDINDDDATCANFWDGGAASEYIVGKGNTVLEALFDLYNQLKT